MFLKICLVLAEFIDSGNSCQISSHPWTPGSIPLCHLSSLRISWFVGRWQCPLHVKLNSILKLFHNFWELFAEVILLIWISCDVVQGYINKRNWRLKVKKNFGITFKRKIRILCIWHDNHYSYRAVNKGCNP